MDTFYSGGAKGTDRFFGECAEKHNHKVVHFTFKGHNSPCPLETLFELDQESLNEADPYLKDAKTLLKRIFPARTEYVNNLLRRNYHIIKNSNIIYALTEIDEDNIPTGGTGWGVALSFLLNKEVFIFDPTKEQWFKQGSVLSFRHWEPIKENYVPKPSGKYAGIGSRNLTRIMKNTIEKLYEK